MNVWVTMILAGLATYATRLSFFVVFGRRGVPESLARPLRYIPPAVFSAIVFPELLMPGGNFDLSMGNLRLLAGVLAALVAWRTRNIVFTILVGMAALWILQWLMNVMGT